MNHREPVVQEPHPMGDLRSSFHHALDEIRADIANLSASVTEKIQRATDILLTQDLEAVQYMIAADDEVDSKSLALEEGCYSLLALQAPMARDLREVVAAVGIIGEVERSADLVVNIAKAARRIDGHSLDPLLRGLIEEMGTQAHQLFNEATEAYRTSDATIATSLDGMDGDLDDLHGQLVQAIFERHSGDRLELQVAVQLAVVARFYERIGDHAVNIAERVRYLVTGGLPGHDGATRLHHPG